MKPLLPLRKNLAEAALDAFQKLPKITQFNLSHNPGAIKKRPHVSSRGQHGHSPRGAMQQLNYEYLGYEGGQTPFYKRVPITQFYNFGENFRREYPPLTLYNLQLLIDTKQINPNKPIDIKTILATKFMKMDRDSYYGIHLTDKGLNHFNAKIDIEVQWASEQVIAAIERCGGSITLTYYDPISISILKDPLAYFRKGEPLPRRLLPPKDILEFYSDPQNRGYLVPYNPLLSSKIEGPPNNPIKMQSPSQYLWLKKLETAQKYGYDIYYKDNKTPVTLDNIQNFWMQNDASFNAISPDFPSPFYTHKTPHQIFEGLKPGCIINLQDKVVLNPTSPEWKKYYEGQSMTAQTHWE